LLEARGNLVNKCDIMSRVWPSTLVEEINLRVQIRKLRTVLGRQAIKSVAGRGYLLCADVTTVPQATQQRPLHELGTPDEGVPEPQRDIGLHTPWLHLERSSTTEHGQPSVVVIDDDGDIRESLVGLLRSVGLSVESFASAQQFLTSRRSGRPRCLVLDVRLPGTSGLDFYDDLIKANMRLPVVFISGYADVPMSVRAMKAGAFEFLTKPVRHQDLLDAIQLAIKSTA
jgi:DNA-binding response OmpR family regulator